MDKQEQDKDTQEIKNSASHINEYDPTIFIYEHDSYSLEIYCMGKYALPTLRLSTVIVYHTDRQTRLKLYTMPHDSSDNLPLVLQTIINAQVMLLKGKEASQT